MQEVTLKDIDKLIEKSSEYSSVEKYLEELAFLIIPFLEIDVQTINYQSLLNKELEQSNKRFIAFCLLRVYGKNPSLLTDMLVKHNIHQLFEQAIPEIYKGQLQITSKTKTYDIEGKLSSFIKEFEKKINTEINTQIDLQYVQSFEKSYRAIINRKNNYSLLSQFFGGLLSKQVFSNLFKILIEYNGSEDNKKPNLYYDAKKKLEKIIDDFNEVRTKYSIDFVVKPFSLILKKLENDFENNPYCKPAKLSIKKTGKKYPFLRGVDYKLQLLVENISTGYASNVIVKIELYSEKIIKLSQVEQFIGEVKTSSIVEFDYTGIDNSGDIILLGHVEWVNFDKKSAKSEFELELTGQKSNVNWVELENEEPYDLEAVADKNEFIGRKKIIDDLTKRIRKKVGSSYIFGQRRVGKTSIVKTLQSITKSKDILVIYIEAGDWHNAKSPHRSMEDLGKKLCGKIKRHSKKFKSLKIPKFEGSFNRITEFLDEVSEINSSFRVLMILDEFDRVSNKLLHSGDIASSFVNTIRAISNREQFGFILVGGEKMEYILSQWQEFNKFKSIRVDYFDKETEWDDFKNLIKYPIKGKLEITDKAIDYIYKQTSGNPYFTKKICMELFSMMVENRDSHITEDEAKKATHITRGNNNIAATDFSHFWKDGIKEKEEKEEGISINRRKVLLSIGQILRSNKKATEQMIIDRSITNGLNNLQAKKTLEEFVLREILKIENNSYRFIVKFFEDWLISNGLDKIITTFEEEEIILLREENEKELRVTFQELNSLSQKWGTYQGGTITSDVIREWLEQFESIGEQRIIFKLLKNTKLYNPLEIREKMRLLYAEVKITLKTEGYIRQIGQKSRKRNDIIVSYLDKNPVKSGSKYATLFVEVNGIYKDQSISPDKLEQKILKSTNTKAVVFIDDFIGTGNSIIENLMRIIEQSKKIIKEKEIIIIVGVISGFQEAEHKITEFTKTIDFPIELILLDPLNDNDKCFHDNSAIYTEPLERREARDICYKIGLELEKRHPLGYNDCQATVVFPDTCPNNSLPILWKETKKWKPLFKRG